MLSKALGLGLALLVLLAAAPPRDPVCGVWQTETHHGVVRISPCGASVCGVLVTSDKLRQQPDLTDIHNPRKALRARKLIGLILLYGFHKVANGWAGGIIYNPDDGNSYHARLTLIDPNHLRVRGCVFVPLCKSQIWHRLPASAPIP